MLTGLEDVFRQDPVDEEILVAVDLTGDPALMVGIQPRPIRSGHSLREHATWKFVEYCTDKWKG
jgi:hypothetical protein